MIFLLQTSFSRSSKRKSKRNPGMRIPRAPERKPRKPYVKETSDDEKEKLDSILGDASRSKTQYQDQHTRARGNNNISFLGENVPNVATTAPPSENITMSLDMSTGSSKGTLLSGLALRDQLRSKNITLPSIIQGNATSKHKVNGEATGSTPRHTPAEISVNVFKNLPVNPTENEKLLKLSPTDGGHLDHESA
ncbi:hypothetical protein BHYA_0104g00250 [Botrytis hyacinthi]|uniref:Uncharacterized protein n=1 Tax=Botrytis hyacinthi TaxID=278943 RepID=A0A4Z1GUU0_9HELO|nr:hypothetical protein BHYA_0104g00250 [Botrytis hyacinthi]